MPDTENALQEALGRAEAERDRLRLAVNDAAAFLRGPLRADTINEVIRSLNRVLPRRERIKEVAWGVASLESLQRSVRDLAIVVGLPDWGLFLTRQLERGEESAPRHAGIARQPIGGRKGSDA